MGLELWENTGQDPKKALDNYIIDSWRWPKHSWDLGLSQEAPFVAIGLELWENTGYNPKKALDNYYIDSWKWPIVQKRT